jgi:HTH-type transcriptional regulator/antitoxin HipB
LILSVGGVLLPYGNENDHMKYTPTSIGLLVRETRKAQGLRQADLALTCGTGLRFVIDLEKGKPSCQFGKVLTVLQTLGITIGFDVPPAPPRGGA